MNSLQREIPAVMHLPMLSTNAWISTSFLGLVAASELPLPSWAQFGLAGLSLFVLFFVLTRTHPREMREQRESNERNVAAMIKSNEETRDKFIEMIREQRGPL